MGLTPQLWVVVGYYTIMIFNGWATVCFELLLQLHSDSASTRRLVLVTHTTCHVISNIKIIHNK